MNTMWTHVREEKEVQFRSCNKCYLLLTPRNVNYFSDNFPYEAEGYFIFFFFFLDLQPSPPY
jgi:hypothetical protein